ncbi:MAG: FAD:protein FMN transferase [Bacteroidia bacterium]|nr:FAD:protein FMN transferase [Bacteroidia bacterium]
MSVLPLLWQVGVAQQVPSWEFAHQQMGTTFRIVINASDSTGAAKAAESAFLWLDTLNAQLSDYLPESEVSQLSLRSGNQEMRVVSAPLFEVINRAQEVSYASDGAFDITIGPLSQVWRRAFRRAEFPEEDRIAEAQSRVDFRALIPVPDSQAVKLLLPNMQLDLGGIAKGFAAEKMLDRLILNGFPHSLVDAGGDIALGYPPSGKPGWRVLPLWPDEELQPIFLANTAIATSGDTYRYLEWEGQRYSHIIDPRSGFGISRQRLVTVQTGSATLADALASLVSVMGGDAFPIAERLAGDDQPLQIWLWENTPKGWILIEFSNL